MDQETVRRLEDEIELAISRALKKLGQKQLPLLPTDQTVHLMSKAAVTVFEAAVENRHPDE